MGIEIQTYFALIACLLISLTTAAKPTLRTYEMVCYYFTSLADEEELLRFPRLPAEAPQRVERGLGQKLRRISLRLGQEEPDRLPGAMMAAGGLDLPHAAPPLHCSDGDDGPPQMAKMTRSNQFASATKKPLAKPRKSSHLGHRVLPPKPAPGQSREGVLSDTPLGMKAPFSSNKPSSIRC